MKIIIVDSYEEMSIKAASIVQRQLNIKPDCVLGCATGHTPLGMYKELIKAYRRKEVDFEQTVFFNLDEYCNIDPKNKQSYHYYMNHNFFAHVNAKRDNIFILNGMAKDFDQEIKMYDQQIKAKGGIDLQILGIGENGHIGFNEPGESFETGTHIVQLQESTINSNSKYFPSKEDVPTAALTMGTKSIIQARMLLLLANGPEKASVVYETVKGKVTPQVPASIIQLHPNAVLVIEKSAAAFI